MIKDSLLVDSKLLLEFWAETIDTANYLQNCLSIKSQRRELIPEESWIEKKQDISHLKVFDSIVSVVISKKKRHKSDIYKNQKNVFIGYSQDTTKHIYTQALKTQQIFLVDDLYIEKLE